MKCFGRILVGVSLIVALVFVGAALYADERAAVEAYDRGGRLLLAGRTDEAIAAFTEAINEGGNKWQYAAGAYNIRGIAYRHKGQYDKAIADYNKAIQINPKYAIAYLNRGIAYRHKGQYDKAIADYTKAIELNPRDAFAYNNRGLVYRMKGQYDAAIADCTKAIELNPNYARAYNNRGLVYAFKGQYDAAIADYSKATQLNPKYATAWNNKGHTLRELGKFTEALECHNKATELASNDTYFIASEGFTLEKMGKKAEAEAAYREALKVDAEKYVGGAKAWIIYGEALAYGRLADKENCFKALKTSIELLPRLKDDAKRDTLLEEYFSDPDFMTIVK